MKKIILIFAVILMISQNAFSQNTDKKFTIQTSPFLWFTDVITLEGDTLFAMDVESQFKITNTTNISLTVSFLLEDSEFTEYYPVESSYRMNLYQINVKPMIIIRPFETGIKGFYVGFYPNVGFVNIDSNKNDYFFTELGFGINLGYKWVFRRGFTMQLGGGIGKTFSIPKGSREYITLNSDGRLSLRYTDIQIIDFKLGYSF